jgi:hypothetical protein
MRDRSRSTVFTSLLLILASLLSSPAFSAEPSPATRSEIAHLLSYLETSGCQFYRNGSWYGPKEARTHLEMKYRYAVKTNRVFSTEDFIAGAASKSSMSGKPYQVKCDRNAPVTTAEWFTAELLRYREEQRAQKP